jgi:microsomal dipeptidase-like Zn-dependent dipeptidase
MIDVHVHFPMHLLEGVESPRDVIVGMTRVREQEHGKLRAAVFALAARVFNFRYWHTSWRVTPELLQAGDVSIACSVLYRPFSELDLHAPYGAPPRSAYYDKLVELMAAVEREVERTGGTIVHGSADLERVTDGPRYVHCIEGGFHLGATPEEVTAHVYALADRGVLYITLAHLFWRQVAANTPALPFLPDAVYDRLFPQAPGLALSPLGEAAVRAMYERRVLVDISHMREDAIAETFAIVEALDRETGRDPREYPIIASHSAYRFGRGRYGLTDGTIARIAARGGVIGLIFGQAQLKDGVQRTNTTTLDESLDLLSRHINAIDPAHVAIGSDLDGFIKPTLGGVESAADLRPFAQALRERYPETADAMLSTNALRVIRTRFASAEP